MMTDGECFSEGLGARSPPSGELEAPEWVAVKSLLEVNDACTGALEEFMLYSTTGRMDDLPADELAVQLDELIEKQRRAITELELARDAIRELDAE